jgi:hypothetical protein
MKRSVLLKTLAIAAPLIWGSSAANAYIVIYSDLTCKYAAPQILNHGPVPTVTIRNIGPKFIPAKTQYTVKFIKTGATIHLKLDRPLAPKQSATAPVQQVPGDTSICRATAAIEVPISGGGSKKS